MSEAPEVEVIDLDGTISVPIGEHDPVALANEGVAEAKASASARSYGGDRCCRCNL